MSPPKPKTFRVVLEKVEATPPWVVARLPFDPTKAWTEWTNRRIRGTLNGFEFRTSLLKTKDQGYWFVVYKKMLQEARVKAGEKVEIRLEPDLNAHVYNEPKELSSILRQDKGLRRWYDAMPASVRRWFAMWIDQAKRAETREERAERVAETVMQVMEGLESPPPILRAAFQRQPLAEQAWHASTRAQRRNHLLGIFMAQGVEARGRRVAYALEKCMEGFHRKAGGRKGENGRFEVD